MLPKILAWWESLFQVSVNSRFVVLHDNSFVTNVTESERFWQMDSQRYVVKHGLIVEKIAKERKLRHVFLFNDIIVAAKQKIDNRFVTTIYFSVIISLAK